MELKITLENAKQAYNNTKCQDVKNTLIALFGKKHFEPEDICDTVTCIEDVFKHTGESYTEFMEKHNGLSESALNYVLLEKGIAYLNQGWKPDFNNSNQEKWFNYFDMRGSDFVFSGSDYGCVNSYASNGATLRFKNKKLAEHAAKVFFPQYRGYMKPKSI